MRIFLRLALICIISLLSITFAFAQDNNSTDPLVRILVTKGVITADEARVIVTNASPAEHRRDLSRGV